ncbi:MAG TPA: heterodisulfide reductase-related iron-sulfur binding cluster [Opitutaceae bacterium]|nr:heterodisulfide reductase-related iron-sulfur binding cluster [Opitutaceae bacterium]
MLHAIKPDGPFGESMAKAVQTCVHCGFCLSACPTYQEFGEEMDSPRGRIVLMKQVLEGGLAAEAAQPHIDRCLGCLACEPACPSGVVYRDLISPFRATMESEGKFRRGPAARFRRWVAGATIPHPARFRGALVLARMARPFRALVPPSLRPMLELAPSNVPKAIVLPEFSPARGARRARVALLAGCAQQVLDPDINLATIEVLTRNGVEVVVPPGQGCCGGLAWHTGDLAAARGFARRNLDAFPADVDAVVTNAAGCGSMLHEYHLVLAGTPDSDRAETFRHRVVDVSVFLARLGLRERPPGTGRQRLAYHDACHLANAQGVRVEPRDLLRAVPGLELVEVPDPHLCCGSAGTYNLDQPETAASLGEKKARAIIGTGATAVATGNIGCLTQIGVHLRNLGSPIRIRHTMQVLRDAY